MREALVRERTMLIVALALLFWHGEAHALRQGTSERIFENDRVIIWRLRSGVPETPLLREPRAPGVMVRLADGVVRVIDGVDALGVRERAAGNAGSTDGRRAILIQLKDYRAAPIESPRGIARAFPREGARRVLDHDRVVVWDLTWTKGMRTSLHFHDKDVVAVYLGAGIVRSTPVAGEPTATPRSFGDAVFLPRGRTHVEECIDGPRRDIIVELK